jgi:hypothetical protein
MDLIAQQETVALPHPNSYRLPGTRVLAGEYPFTLDPGEAREKLRRHLEVGIDTFLDLTEEGELLPYEAVLREEAERLGVPVVYERHPIRDMGIASRERMERVLDAIDAAQEAGRRTYVHCWGGVGRTGTVVGCYMVRRGLTGEEALARVEAWFAGMSRDKVWRHPEGSPQTEAQRAFVRSWAGVAEARP